MEGVGLRAAAARSLPSAPLTIVNSWSAAHTMRRVSPLREDYGVADCGLSAVLIVVALAIAVGSRALATRRSLSKVVS
jgi:hypothetical protein